MKFVSFAIFTTILVFIFSPLLLAQEDLIYMYYKESDKGDSAFVIDTGYAVINGVLFRPPFKMELKNDTIWINQVAAHPDLDYPGDPRNNPLYPSPIKLDSSQQELVETIKDTYNSYNEQYGERKALEMTVSQFQSNPLLSSLTSQESEASASFTLIFSNGIPYGISLRLDISKMKEEVRHAFNTVPPDTVKADQRRLTRELFSTLPQHFQRGNMMFFSGGSMGGNDPKAILEIVLDIKNGVLSQKEGVERLGKLIGSPEAIMIIEHLDSW